MILSKLLNNVIVYQTLLVIVPAVISVYNYAYLSKGLKFLSFYLYLSLLSEVLSRVLTKHLNNNLPLLHIFTLLEFILISLVYYKSFNNKNLKKIIIGVTVIVSSFIILNSFFLQDIYSFNTNARVVEDIVFILYPLAFFYSILKELKIVRLEKEPMFWINIGVLLYFSCNLFIFIFSNYLLESLTRVNNLWIWFVHGVFNVLMYLLFSKGLWHSRKKNAYY